MPPLRYSWEIASVEFDFIERVSTSGPSSSRKTSYPCSARTAALSAPPAPDPITTICARREFPDAVGSRDPRVMRDLRKSSPPGCR